MAGMDHPSHQAAKISCKHTATLPAQWQCCVFFRLLTLHFSSLASAHGSLMNWHLNSVTVGTMATASPSQQSNNKKPFSTVARLQSRLSCLMRDGRCSKDTSKKRISFKERGASVVPTQTVRIFLWMSRHSRPGHYFQWPKGIFVRALPLAPTMSLGSRLCQATVATVKSQVTEWDKCSD